MAEVPIAGHPAAPSVGAAVAEAATKRLGAAEAGDCGSGFEGMCGRGLLSWGGQERWRNAAPVALSLKRGKAGPEGESAAVTNGQWGHQYRLAC